MVMEFAKLTFLEGQQAPSDKLEGEVACFVKHQLDVLRIFCDGECAHVANINRIAEILQGVRGSPLLFRFITLVK